MTTLTKLIAEMTAWRRDMHANPELGFQEKHTSALVAHKLREFGLTEVAEGIGGTGVVGTLKLGDGNRAIALRADMDALRITEAGSDVYASRNLGVMHACGHDGHTAMLLGAAKLLSEEGGFDGTVHFVFQPCEEWGKGALAMINDGLFDRFPCDEIYGIHNMPGLPIGSFQTRPRAMTAAEDNFEIKLSGVGGHAAQPHKCNETMVAACSLVVNLQTILSRRIDPANIAVVSVTEIISDGARNTLPGTTRVLGDARSFEPQVSETIEREIRAIADGTALAFNLRVNVEYSREFVPLHNDVELAAEAIAVATQQFGAANVEVIAKPVSGSEDFAQFLAYVPGCFVFLGNGADSKPLHNPSYDFNDDGLVHGMNFHAAIVRRRLPMHSQGN